MVTRPMTTEELFNNICGILKEKGKMLDILDYGLPTSNPVPIRMYVNVKFYALPNFKRRISRDACCNNQLVRFSTTA